MRSEREGQIALLIREGWDQPEEAIAKKIKEAIARGADVSGGALNGNTMLSALEWSAVHDKKELTEILLEAGAPLEAPKGQGGAALIQALHWGREELSLRLLEAELRAGSLRERVRSVGGELLSKAAAMKWKRNGNARRMIQALLDQKANPDEADERGKIPLRWAIESDNKEAFELLLPVSDWSRSDEKGRTPMGWAFSAGKIEMGMALLRAGAPIQSEGEDMALLALGFIEPADLEELLSQRGALELQKLGKFGRALANGWAWGELEEASVDVGLAWVEKSLGEEAKVAVMSMMLMRAEPDEKDGPSEKQKSIERRWMASLEAMAIAKEGAAASPERKERRKKAL